MKRLAVSWLCSCMFLACHSQPGRVHSEFTSNTNGLMYSESDMKTLRFIVDSLNLRFKSCKPNKIFYSLPQVKVYEVEFRGLKDDLAPVIKDIKAKMDFDTLCLKYSAQIHSHSKDQLLILSKTKDKDYYLYGRPNTGYGVGYSLPTLAQLQDPDIKNTWVYELEPRGRKDEQYELTCRFFPTNCESIPLPEEYGQLINYVDCMIDTSSVILLNDKRESYLDTDNEAYSAINHYLNKKMGRKKKGKEDWEYTYLTNEKINFANENLRQDANLLELIQIAYEECEKTRHSNDAIESLVGTFLSKEKELYLKRCRRVIGNCSMDDSPRQHARSIALLAGEAHKWDIFLRAHLDIMNDRFERRSDGSYAWAARQTYLKELEELNLEVVDLMLGLSLRAKNTADNHYNGSINRLGRALTESRQKDLFETKVFAMMKDPRLDDFNRGLMFLLYTSYTYYLNREEGKQKRDQLRISADNFPADIRTAIDQLKEPKVSGN